MTLPGIPPLSFGSSSRSGDSFLWGGGFGAGDWNVNLGGSGAGSGTGNPGSGGTIPPLVLWIGLGLAAWYVYNAVKK